MVHLSTIVKSDFFSSKLLQYWVVCSLKCLNAMISQVDLVCIGQVIGSTNFMCFFKIKKLGISGSLSLHGAGFADVLFSF